MTCSDFGLAWLSAAAAMLCGCSSSTQPASASTSGSAPVVCEQSNSTFNTTAGYGWVQYGNYTVQNNNYAGTADQSLWAISADCWGVTTAATTERFGIGSSPSVQRGWSQNGATLSALSDPGTNDWTTKSGMGIRVTALTKDMVHWAFTGPAVYPASRWDALIETDFHQTNDPPYTAYYPYTQLMVTQAISDQVLAGNGSYYGTVVAANHGTQVTIAGTTYTVYVDNPKQKFNQTGGHTIWMAVPPTTLSTGNSKLAMWGSMDAVTDLGALIQFWMQSNPVDDTGAPIQNAAGEAIVSPLITSDLYVNQTIAGFEIDYGSGFNTTAFCISLQDEPDCP